MNPTDESSNRARWRSRPSMMKVVAVVAAIVMVAAACGGDDDSTTAPASSGDSASSDDGTAQQEPAPEPEPIELEEVQVILGWLAEPSRGGLFAAQQQGFYEEVGLEVTLNAGTDISAVQLVGAGRAEFGIGDADELLSAREQGIPVVALSAAFQDNPRILVYHLSNPVADFESLVDRTVYLDLGDDWWEWVKGEFELGTDVDERSYTGQLANFIADENALVQGYIGSEDVTLASKGIDVGVLRVGESGFNPYTNILFTTEDFIAESPDIVTAMVEATTRGWEFYKEGYPEVHPGMQGLNAELTLESMELTAEAQRDFIYGGDAATYGVGYMSEERWVALDRQLRELGVIEEEFDLSAVWTTEFLAG